MATTWLDLYLQDKSGEPKVNFDGEFEGVRFGSLPKNRWYTSLFYGLSGLEARRHRPLRWTVLNGTDILLIAKSVNGRRWI